MIMSTVTNWSEQRGWSSVCLHVLSSSIVSVNQQDTYLHYGAVQIMGEKLLDQSMPLDRSISRVEKIKQNHKRPV